MKTLTAYPEWQLLDQHQVAIASQHLRQCFMHDPTRASRYQLSVGGIVLDYSRNRIDDQTLVLLKKLATATHLATKIEAFLSGQLVNTTEKRAALHTALRDFTCQPIYIQGENISSLIIKTQQQMRDFTAKIHTKTYTGATGKPIQHIVNIGIGGSYAGPLLGIQALKDFAVSDLQFHFIATLDPALRQDVMQRIDPETTLFIISSKSFGTLETLHNAQSLWQWMEAKVGKQVQQHFIAVTAAPEKARALGILPSHIFPLWDWVGGRYSIWSAIGLPLMLMIGAEAFMDFLRGAHEMDLHFRHSDYANNMPVLVALLSLWYINFFGVTAQAIAPYSYRLRSLVPYLQQAEMESNGKHMDLAGNRLHYATSPVVFGQEGCTGQHSYHQLLHQGQPLVPVDFILLGKPDHRDPLIASGLSQAEALMRGKTYEEAYAELIARGYAASDAASLAPHQVVPGNKPCNIFFLEQLTPKNLGALLALYEHKIFVQGAIWGINSFDQWGVELGKQLYKMI